MDLVVRPAAAQSRRVGLLFASAKPYCTAYVGSEKGAVALLQRVSAQDRARRGYG